MTPANPARLLTVVLTGVALAGLGLAAPGGAAHPRCADAAGAHHVAVVAEHASQRVVSTCIAFDGDSIAGGPLMAAAQQQGITYVTGYGGRAVCQIDYEPTPVPSGCFGSSWFWALFYSRGGGPWVLSVSSAFTDLSFRDGDALGWRFVQQQGGCPNAQGTCPVPPAPAGVCPANVPPPPAQQAPAAVPGAAPPPSAPASDPGAPAAIPSPAAAATPTPDASAAAPSQATPGVASAVRPAAPPGTRPSGGVEPGPLAASAAAGLLGALVLLQLLAPRIRR